MKSRRMARPETVRITNKRYQNDSKEKKRQKTTRNNVRERERGSKE